jgi:hypothetical protein
MRFIIVIATRRGLHNASCASQVTSGRLRRGQPPISEIFVWWAWTASMDASLTEGTIISDV